jgi:outer membrane protein assembly factor BamB
MRKQTVQLALIFMFLFMLSSTTSFLNTKGDLSSTDWPMFRYNVQHTGASTSTSPSSANLLWVFNTSAEEVHNSLAAVDGMIFVAASNGNVYAINSSTGQQIWMQITANRENSVWSSPAVSSGRLYVGTRDHNLYCLNATTGTILWQFLSNNEIDCSPVVTTTKVIFNTVNGTVYCLNSETGSLQWIYNFGTYNFASPAMIDENTVAIAAGNLYTIDALTGQLIWQLKSSYLDNSPAIADGKIFASNGTGLICVDAVSAYPVWNISLSGGMGPLYRSSLAVDAGMVFIHSSATVNNFLGINATTGAIVWASTVSSFDFCSSPAVADGKVFIGADYGKLYCFNSTNGQIIWSYLTGESIRSSPIVAYGNVYVGSDTSSSSPSSMGQVYAFGAAPLAQTTLSLSLKSQTSLLGFSVTLNGELLMENQTAVSNARVKFSYSINNGQSWNDITSTFTSADGSYSAVWTPSAIGTFLVKASYDGLYPYQSSQKNVELSVLPYNNQYVFAVSSNSTVSSLAFNSQSNTLSFTVSGPSDTTGYVDMQIAKNLVPDIANLKVNLDGSNLIYTATSNSESYLLHFTYTHSSHTITVNLGTAPTTSPTPSVSTNPSSPTPSTSPTSTPTSTPQSTNSPEPSPSPTIPEISIIIVIIFMLTIPLTTMIYRKKHC